jgi:hypothetical protein
MHSVSSLWTDQSLTGARTPIRVTNRIHKVYHTACESATVAHSKTRVSHLFRADLEPSASLAAKKTTISIRFTNLRKVD